MKNITIDGVEYTPILKNKEIPQIIVPEQLLKFEVYSEDLDCMNWYNAIKACSNLGNDWRLPTNIELLLMFYNKNKICGFADYFYWSSTEYDSFDAWYLYFFDGGQDYFNKYSTAYVRAVRSI